eukprot:73394-Prymnesium_polylepis.1
MSGGGGEQPGGGGVPKEGAKPSLSTFFGVPTDAGAGATRSRASPSPPLGQNEMAQLRMGVLSARRDGPDDDGDGGGGFDPE